jgi:hypothetical protein
VFPSEHERGKGKPPRKGGGTGWISFPTPPAFTLVRRPKAESDLAMDHKVEQSGGIRTGVMPVGWYPSVA